MQKLLVIITIITLFTACLPVKISPKIENYKIVKAHKFSKKLPKTNAFIFKDSKKVGEIYQFIQAKFKSIKELENYYTFNLNGINYSIKFYEVEKETKTVNLIPVLIDANREQKGNEPLLEDFYISRKSDNWYIAMTVQNEKSSDCLQKKNVNKKEIEKYLEKLKNEYLSTSNYMETKILTY
jgi:hypothetical protein